jgi:hypothetical protein
MRAILSISFVLFFGLIFAHSGGTDSEGGHLNHTTGDYHFHHGFPPHSHEGGCPYSYEATNDFDLHASKKNVDSKENLYYELLGQTRYYVWITLIIILSFLLAVSWGEYLKKEKTQKYFRRILLFPTFILVYLYPIYYCITQDEHRQALGLIIIINLLIIIVPVFVASSLWMIVIEGIKNGIKRLKIKMIESEFNTFLRYEINKYWDKFKYTILLILSILFLATLFYLGPKNRYKKYPNFKSNEQKMIDELNIKNEELHKLLDSLQ